MSSIAAPPKSISRERVIASLLLAVWAVLSARLVDLHLHSGEEFERLANRQRTVREEVAAKPGEIVDRHGHVLATSVAVRSVFVVPSRIRQGWSASRQLAEALELDPDQLFERIAAHPGRHFLWVKRRVSEEEADRVRALHLPPDSWGFRDEFRRYYPQASAAAQVIGLRDIDERGQGGIEQTFDTELRGIDGWRELVQDARGRVIEIREPAEGAPRHGASMVLTLDAVIQAYAERALDGVVEQWKPRSACAIVLDPRSGDLLAMASRPTFDPNQPGAAPPEAWKNRAIADIYEPGSTFKPFVVAWGVAHGCMGRDEVFDCSQGEYRMGGRVLHDHHPYGKLSVVDILVKSSNIGMAKIGQRMTNLRLHQAAVAFGFGGRTGVELPGELQGVVRPLRKWNAYSTGSVPMGQEIAATPLQIVTAYGALCNDGRLITPRLVIRDDRTHSAPGSTVVSQTVDPEVAAWIIRRPLTEVVQRGTGRKAAIAGYEVFGKTGTAQKLDPQTGLYSRNLHVSSFICGAPADDPRVLVMISVDEPSVAHNGEHFGGSVAAPAAGELLRRCLQRLQVPPNPAAARSALLPAAIDEDALE